MNPIERIAQINAEKSAKALEDKRYAEGQISNIQLQETVVKSFKSLVDYLDNKISRTQVVNQLKEVGTPDALKVIPEIQALHKTLATHKNTDLTEVTKVMKGILDEAKKLPKELPKPEKQQFVDYTKQFKALGDAVKAVEKVVKAQKLIAEAPVVNVPAPNVIVDAPDLSPLQTSIRDVVGAVNEIVIPKYKTDNKAVEGLIKTSNKLLKEILEKPVGGGGGGGQAWTAVNSSGIPMPLNLDADGKLIVAATTSVDTTGLATDTNQTNGSQKTQIVDAGGEAVTVTDGKLDVNASASLAGEAIPISGATTAVGVAIVDGSGNQITSFGGGTQYAEGDTDASFTGTISLVEGAGNTAVTLKQPTQPTDTQPISASSLPLPTGAATAANQQTDALTDAQLRATPVPVSGTVAVTGVATATNQTSQIALQTQLESLIDTLQELVQRLSPLAGAMNNTAQLRVVQTTAPSTAVTGPITSAQSIAEKAVAGIMYTQRVAIENNTAIQSNINNAVA